MHYEDPVHPPIDGHGISGLTARERDCLAWLTVRTVAERLPGEHSHEALSEALGELADQGQVLLRADADNVWVTIDGMPIVHAARNWLRWATTHRTN